MLARSPTRGAKGQELAAGSGIQAKLKEIVPGYQTTVIRSGAVAATVALKGPHEHGAPACPP
jgi:hypothetical protein